MAPLTRRIGSSVEFLIFDLFVFHSSVFRSVYVNRLPGKATEGVATFLGIFFANGNPLGD
jgi:hypothetical protein